MPSIEMLSEQLFAHEYLLFNYHYHFRFKYPAVLSVFDRPVPQTPPLSLDFLLSLSLDTQLALSYSCKPPSLFSLDIDRF